MQTINPWYKKFTEEETAEGAVQQEETIEITEEQTLEVFEALVEHEEDYKRADDIRVPDLELGTFPGEPRDLPYFPETEKKTRRKRQPKKVTSGVEMIAKKQPMVKVMRSGITLRDKPSFTSKILKKLVQGELYEFITINPVKEDEVWFEVKGGFIIKNMNNKIYSVLE